MQVYITASSAFLPNAPVFNKDLDQYAEMFGGRVSKRIKRMILGSNGISARYYAIDRDTGQPTHSNAQLTAEAIRRLNPYDDFTIDDIRSLCCGTASPDQIIPGHASMVHGCLGNQPCETYSFSGICGSGMAALKHAFLSVKAEVQPHAVATGSEIASTFFPLDKAVKKDHGTSDSRHDPVLSFDTEFIKWMLSDGAGGVFLSSKPRGAGLSLRIDWIDQLSYANELKTCMYAGALKQADGELIGWRELAGQAQSGDDNCFLIHQDVKLLNKYIVETSINRALCDINKQRHMQSDDIDWFLPHYSSAYFRDPLYKALVDINFEIPYEKWFTNLAEKGNTGAASIFIMLDELYTSGKIKPGQKLLCFVPESGRFSFNYMHLTAV